MTDKFSEYQLPTTAYTTFDAESLRDLIISRLNEQGTFTDQVYRGSNMSSYIDVIAYSYHVLMYYLNRTSSESLFSEATVYENVNKIVKLLNYSPLGYQTSTLNFTAFATDELVPGTYTIPRYTYLTSNNVTYSIDTDISFTKNTPGLETIDVIGDQHLLYEGKWVENSQITALGQDYETHVLVSTSDNVKLDHFHVHVYVKDSETGRYHQYEETTSLYLNGPTDRVFEKRLDENEMYELRFGNNITGARLKSGDIIQVYYMEIRGESGEVGTGFLNDLRLNMYGTSIFNTVKNDVKPENINYITFDDLESLYFTNSTASTKFQQRETVEDIKRKAPVHFATQDRLVTLNEFSAFMDKSYGNMLTSSKVVDNETYMDGHMRYLTEKIGIDNPNLESRVMFNHLDMSTSTHFNNVYIYGVPRMVKTTSLNPSTNFMSQSQKQLILNSIRGKKMISHEIVLQDPVYVAVDVGLVTGVEQLTPDVATQAVVEVKRASDSLRDDQAIKQEIIQLITEYFSNTRCDLGQLIDLSYIGSQMLQITGVESIHTYRPDIDLKSPGLSLIIWNPVYNTDITVTNQNIQLPFYKFPYLHDPFGLNDKIQIVH